MPPVPAGGNYSADRLGDDVLAVADSLKLNRPILAGHSIAGEELSSVGTRHPEKIAALIYLDAGYGYAYYDRSRGDLVIDSIDLEKKLDQLVAATGPRERKSVIQEIVQTNLPQLEKDLKEQQKDLQAIPDSPPGGSAQPRMPEKSTAAQAIVTGEEKYTDIKCPVLAIFAVPHDLGPLFQDDPAARAAAEADDRDRTPAQAKAFETGVPSAHVVRLPNADHYVFLSNEADVLREMKAFIANLPAK